MRTWLTDTCGVRVPVALATMAGAAGASLAAAVSRAGGLGGIGVGSQQSGDWLIQQAAVLRAESLPYSVGLMAWALERSPGQLDATADLAPALVSLSFEACDGDGGRLPVEAAVRRLRDAGSRVVTQVGSVEHARRMVDQGVDAVIARGREGGGHGYDTTGTLVLLAETLDAVDVPVLAAGGIGSARGLAAVLAAGAAGAWVGTAFSTCVESDFDDDASRVVHEAGSGGTSYNHTVDRATGVGWPDDIGGRFVRNEFLDTWRGREGDMLADESAMHRFRSAPADRDMSTRPVPAGEAAGLVHARRPAASVLAELAAADGLIRRAARECGEGT